MLFFVVPSGTRALQPIALEAPRQSSPPLPDGSARAPRFGHQLVQASFNFPSKIPSVTKFKLATYSDAMPCFCARHEVSEVTIALELTNSRVIVELAAQCGVCQLMVFSRNVTGFTFAGGLATLKGTILKLMKPLIPTLAVTSCSRACNFVMQGSSSEWGLKSPCGNFCLLPRRRAAHK